MRKIRAAVLIMAAMMALPCMAMAEPVENSWRYADGEEIAMDGPSAPAGRPATRRMSARRNAPWSLTPSGWVSSDGVTVIRGARTKGVDVSEHNGVIDWQRVKDGGVSFAIIRCGFFYGDRYGGDGRADRYWERNASECERLGIPYGVYLYSYARNRTQASKEAAFTLDLLRGHHPTYPVYYDMEDECMFEQAGHSAGAISSIGRTYCERVRAAGYKSGIYSSLSWWRSYLTDPALGSYSRWVAQWNVRCDYGGRYRLWQSTSDGGVPGIAGRVDIDFDYESDDALLMRARAAANVGGSVLPSGRYAVVPVCAPSDALDVSASSTRNGANVQIWTRNPHPAQVWDVRVDGQGFVTLRSLRSGKMLDVSASRRSAGTNIQQWAANGAAAQSWAPSRNADGSITLWTRLGGELVADVENGSSVPGTNVRLWTHNGSGAQSFRFVRVRDLSGADVEVGDVTYDGTAQRPEVSVSLGGKALPRGAYSLEYDQNRDAGRATVRVLGRGAFYGIAHGTFAIGRADIADAEMGEIAPQEWTAGRKAPGIDARLAGMRLVEGRDYTVGFGAARLGRVTATVTGIGNLRGEVKVGFDVVRADIAHAYVAPMRTQPLHGDRRPKPHVTYAGIDLVEGVDYRLSYEGNDGPGTARLTISGIGNMTGERTEEFALSDRAIDDSCLSVGGPYMFTGADVRPDIDVTFDGRRLALGRDYVVSYADNRNVGTASATVQGIGAYTGEGRIGFGIVPAPASSLSVSVPDAVYDGTPRRPRATVRLGGVTLGDGDYDVTYADNVGIGRATACVRGTGNVTGTASAAFDVTPGRYCRDVLGAGSGRVCTIGSALRGDARVDIAGGSVSDGAAVRMWASNEAPAQRFRVSFHDVSNGYGWYSVVNVKSGKAITAGASRGTPVRQRPYAGSANQRWYARRLGGHWQMMAYDGNMLDVTASSRRDGALVETWPGNGCKAQRFSFVWCDVMGSGTKSLVSAANRGYALSVQSGARRSGANVRIWGRGRTTAQMWDVRYEPSTGYYRLVSKRTGQSLGVSGARRSPGANVQTWYANRSLAQRWSVVRDIYGRYELVSACNGLALDVSGGIMRPGTNVRCWSRNGTAAQRWKTA